MTIVLDRGQTDVLLLSPLFSHIEKNEALSMMKCLEAEKKSYDKDEIIFNEGDPSGWIGVVLNGSVRIFMDTIEGNRTILSVVREGELFAEAFACADIQELPVSVQAAENTTLLFVKISKVLTTCTNSCSFHQTLIRNLLRIVAQKNLQMNRKLRILAHRTTREKLLAYLGEQAKSNRSRSFSIPLDRQGLADYLGVDRSAMSAELGKLQKEGILKTKKNRFILFSERVSD